MRLNVLRLLNHEKKHCQLKQMYLFLAVHRFIRDCVDSCNFSLTALTYSNRTFYKDMYVCLIILLF